MTTARGRRAPRTFEARPRPIIRATELGTVAVLKEGPLVLLSDAFGDVAPDRRGLGLYLGDTRILSTALLLVEGHRPTVLMPDPGGAASGVVQLTNPELPGDPTRAADHPVALPRQSIGIRRVRTLHDGTFDERIVFANYATAGQRLRVRLLLDVDGADIFEVRGYDRPVRGDLLPILVEDSTAVFRYAGLDGRELRSTVGLAAEPAFAAPGRDDELGALAASWTLDLPAGGEGEIGWTVRASWGDSVLTEPATAERAMDVVLSDHDEGIPAGGAPGEVGATIETDDELVNLILARALADLRLLRTPGPGPGEHFVAAGIPWFTTLFGRDSLIAAYAALPYAPGLARDALAVLARLQADEDDPAADAEPGKILHEMRTGEMARTGELPFARYYGTADATPLWLIVLGEAVAWTGDGDLPDRYWPTAMRALGWLERSARDADGFITYRTRAPRGLRNQGWKDSGDAIRDRTGALVDPPIALAEVQGYAVEARRRLAELARLRRDADLAARLEGDATALARRFDDRFWQPELDRYAMALGPNGSVADALASNMGHCLWSGVVPPHRAAAVARDLTGPGLFSGWGVRTYGAGQPGFNPLGYHTGSVWPHDTAIAAAGLKRYGFHDEASELAWAVLDAARLAPGFRLPELFCGFDRQAVGVPVVHPVSCAPQAWGASAALMLMTTMLGLTPRALTGELEISRPVLPRGLSKVVVRGLPVGSATVDLLFHRWRGTTSAEVLERRGDLRVVVRL